jgi:two-component system OmpR family sensor kinase
MRSRWLIALLPLLLALVGALLWSNSDWANPVLFARASLSTLLVLLGILLTLLLVGYALQGYVAQRHAREMFDLQAQAAEDRRRFLQRLDHELKNPLMAIRAGLANFANAPTSDTRKEALASVESQTVRLSRLTADLRKIADLETRSLELTNIDLTALLEEAVALVKDRPGAEDRQLALTLPQAPWPLPIISGDWDLIFLAVYNLLENAIKFTVAGETVEIRAREDGRFVVVEVADTGPGIESSEIPHVWEELYRGKGGRGVPGSGLGLALVKAVAERHGGDVALHSRAGQGTVINVQLPIDGNTK